MIKRKQEGVYQGLLRVTLGGRWWTKVFTLCLVCASAAMALPAQTLTTLHSFDETDGATPSAALIQANDGNFYGTTFNGGANNCTSYNDGCGTAFKITPSGTLTTLYSFCSQTNCADGAQPVAGLIQAADGDFYGTTEFGGTMNCGRYDVSATCGTIFKITPNGELTTLYRFCSQSGCADGAQPIAGLLQATDGNFYGTTVGGGVHLGGTVFKITPTGTLTTLYSFCQQSNCTDGRSPFAALAQGSDGNLYGTTAYGGTNDFNLGGTVFKITSSGTLTTLYNFCSEGGQACTDGVNLNAGLVQASDGNFYGTTTNGGVNGEGTAFKITPSGTLTTLYSFCSQSGCADGANPYAALLQAADGSFYGPTAYGGANNDGTVFKISASGTLTMLHSFDFADGANPYPALIQATQGNFYGTTGYGGNILNSCKGGCGTIFSLSVAGSPAVNLSPSSLTFGPQGVQAPNVPQVVTLTNTGQLPLSIISIAVTGQNSGDFLQANNCPVSPNTLGPGDNCAITVVFNPTGSGTLNADVTITDNAPGSPQSVALTGTGVSGKPGLAGPQGAKQTANLGRP